VQFGDKLWVTEINHLRNGLQNVCLCLCGCISVYVFMSIGALYDACRCGCVCGFISVWACVDWSACVCAHVMYADVNVCVDVLECAWACEYLCVEVQMHRL
jgi:hypothetical protein